MMTANASAPSEGKTKQVLEEKLKVHIQREFDLGEKVISLLKQKNDLEAGLQVQLNSKRHLEAQLSEAIAGKQGLEREYSEMQKDLRAQQKSLRQRSRRFSVTEEDSREDLRALHEEIHQLKQQLDLLDNQKVEEHVHLSNTIEELSKKEQHLQQELQKISQQKETAEEELGRTVQRFHDLAGMHDGEKREHEEDIERLQRQQEPLKIRIAHLLDEQQRNERSLQQEIETLKRSKSQLEEKVEQLRQQHPDHDEEAEKELLEVIERQENVIQQLKERAHQRSSMLRAENETLKKEVENMLTEQEKTNWENQMLESSLKSLQHDLAEYLLLKNKFEEAQREKEHFEDAFYRKIQFLEERYTAAGGTDDSMSEEAVHIHHHADTPGVSVSPPPAAAPKKRKPTRRKRQRPVNRDNEKTEKIPSRSWNAIWPKIVLPVGAVLILLLSAVITLQLLKLFKPADIQTTAVDIPVSGYALPDDKFGLRQSDEELSQDEGDFVVSEPDFTNSPVIAEPDKNLQSQPAHAPETGPRITLVTPQPHTTSPPMPVVPAPVMRKPQQVASIVVALPAEGGQRFLPKEQRPFPTLESNVVLRRYHQQRRTSENN